MSKGINYNLEDFPTLAESGGIDLNEQYIPEFKPLTQEDLNLELELLEQYNRARKLLHDANYDSSISLNQKASALNSATAIIGALTKSQAELYSLERVKKIELVLIDVLKSFPEMQEEFMKKYRAALGEEV